MEDRPDTYASVQSYVEKHFLRNSVCMVGLDLFWGLANPFVNWMLLQPILLEGLKGGALVEELPSLSYVIIFGVFSILAAHRFHGARHRTRAAMGLYFIYGLLWLATGVLFLTTNWPRWVYITLVVATSMISNIFNCLGHNQDMYLMVDSIPVRRRGFTWAVRQAGLVLGIFTGAFFVRFILVGVESSADSGSVTALAGQYVGPFGWCFVVGGVLYCLACFTLVPFKEAPPVDHGSRRTIGQFLRDECKYLWASENFRWLTVSNVLSGAVAFGLPAIVTVHAKTVLGEHESVVADFISVVIVFQMIGGVAGGLLGDRLGYKLIGGAALVMLLGTIGVCYWAHDLGDKWLIYSAFAGLGVLAGAGPLARAQFVKEIFPEKDISTVIAIEYMLLLPCGLFGPILFGLLVDCVPGTLGKDLVWLISALYTVASLIVLVWKVSEPRHGPAAHEPASSV